DLVGARGTRFWVVTRGAEATGDRDRPVALAQAPLRGLGRALALEHPELWGGLVDLDPETHPDEARALAAELLRDGSEREDQVAFRSGRRLVARLVPKTVSPAETHGPELRPGGTYLVTGGLGALGLRVARWLVERGARRLVLVGRHGLPSRDS